MTYLEDMVATVDELFPPAYVSCPECGVEYLDHAILRWPHGPPGFQVIVRTFPCGHKLTT